MSESGNVVPRPARRRAEPVKSLGVRPPEAGVMANVDVTRTKRLLDVARDVAVWESQMADEAFRDSVRILLSGTPHPSNPGLEGDILQGRPVTGVYHMFAVMYAEPLLMMRANVNETFQQQFVVSQMADILAEGLARINMSEEEPGDMWETPYVQ